MILSEVYVCCMLGLFLQSLPCEGRGLFGGERAAEVVSKYTTLAPAAAARRPAAPPLDIYQQIANNIAERITSPIYRFLGSGAAPARAHLELVDETPEEAATADARPLGNEIDGGRDVEELSAERMRKPEGGEPEKITLYSGYLPAARSVQNATGSAPAAAANSSGSDPAAAANSSGSAPAAAANSSGLLPDDDDFDFDEFEDPASKGSSGGFVYILELIGSIFTLAWGAIMAYFNPSSS